MKTTLTIFIFSASAVLGCKGDVALDSHAMASSAPATVSSPTPSPNADTPINAAEADEAPTLEAPAALELSPDEATHYLRSIAQMLVSRPLNPAEVQQLQQSGGQAVRPIITQWTKEPGFVESARYMMQQKLKASGDRDGIDFEAPGRLVAYIVGNGLPWSEVIAADYCIAPDGSQSNCDSGAPYNAGVLTTRAYLAGNASRFNLARASRFLKVFACKGYPLNDKIQPYLPKEALIPMFRATNAQEQTVEEAKGAFGNGDECYSCHGQFGAHAQFFVKFDQTGVWRSEATGVQDPDGELGRSVNGLMTSHMDDMSAKAFEGSKMFGKDAANLHEAAEIMSNSETFVPCAARNVLEYTFGMTDSQADGIDEDLLDNIATRATADHSLQPTLADIVIETFVDPRVAHVVLSTRRDPQ